jgi:hypothetical protein
MNLQTNSHLPSVRTHHLHAQKSQAGRVKLQEHVDRFCPRATKFFMKNSFWRVKLWINSSSYVRTLKHLRTDVSTVHTCKWPPSGLVSSSQQRTSSHSFVHSALFAWHHLLATQCIIAMAYAPDTADWEQNFFNLNIIMPMLKYDPQPINTRWFKFPYSKAKKKCYPQVKIWLPIPQYWEIYICIFPY